MPFLNFCAVSGKLVSTAAQPRAIRRLASPGVRSDSCVTTGSPSERAASATGRATYPPLENTPSAPAACSAFFAARTLWGKRKGSPAFFHTPARTNLTAGMA